MKLNSGGYSGTQFNNTKLRALAHDLAKRIPEVLEATGAEAVAVTGKSGLSLAFATQMLLDFPLVVVRKRGENSHGNPIEGPDGFKLDKYIVLDDFISTGNTIRAIQEAIQEQHKCYMTSKLAPCCVGVLTYLREGHNYDTIDGFDKALDVFGMKAGCVCV